MFVFILNVVKGERTLVTELTKQKNDKGVRNEKEKSYKYATIIDG